MVSILRYSGAVMNVGWLIHLLTVCFNELFYNLSESITGSNDRICHVIGSRICRIIGSRICHIIGS
jgi:hypothetical protein